MLVAMNLAASATSIPAGVGDLGHELAGVYTGTFSSSLFLGFIIPLTPLPMLPFSRFLIISFLLSLYCSTNIFS